MDPVTAAALGEMGGSIVGQAFGNNGDEERRRALEILMGVNVETGDVARDMRNAQTSAIDYLRQLYSQGGMDPQSRAALEQAQTQNAASERMSRNAIVQNAAMRSPSAAAGTETMAALANQQGGANRNRMAGTQAGADARTRAIQALLSSGSMAGNVRGQDSALAQFNAAQRLRKATAAAGLTQENAATRNDRFDYGQLGGFAGAALSGLSSKKKPAGPASPWEGE